MTRLFSHREWRHGVAALAMGCALGSCSSQAHSQVFQTDAARTALPQPVGTSELGLGPVWGYVSTSQSYFDPMTGAPLSTPIIYGEYYSPPAFPQFVDGDAFTLSGLFKWRGEQLDPVADATIAPGHFLPGCGFRAELVLQGGDCDVELGWYNFTDNGPPALADIQPLVPKGSTYLNATWATLVPLAWDNRDPRNLSELAWTPQAFDSGDITSNPNYAGGEIAFVMLGDAFSACKTNKFSVYEHNAKNAAGVPWVTALIYASTVDPSATYLAFEDLPMSAADWRDSGGVERNDSDFNDAVFYISGLGAGASCSDPGCRNVVCNLDETCSDGACVPAAGGNGGASEGGAWSSGGGGEATSSSAAGAPAMGQGGIGTDSTNESGGDATASMGGDATASMGGDATTSGGAPNRNPDRGEPSADPGCSCRTGSLSRTRAYPLPLFLTLALVLMVSRRALRGLPRRATEA
jgi:hypothetical protein